MFLVDPGRCPSGPAFPARVPTPAWGWAECTFSALYSEGQSDVYPHFMEALKDEHSMESEDFISGRDIALYHDTLVTGQGCHDLKEEHEDEEMVSVDQLTLEQRRLITLIDGALEFNMKFVRSLHIAPFETTTVQALNTLSRKLGADVTDAALGRDLGVLSTLGSDVGPGVTRDQFRHVMRRCPRCRRFCYKDRQASHRCPAKVSVVWRGGPDELVAYLISSVPNKGLSELDLRRQFVSCGLCRRICMRMTSSTNFANIVSSLSIHAMCPLSGLTQEHQAFNLGGEDAGVTHFCDKLRALNLELQSEDRYTIDRGSHPASSGELQGKLDYHGLWSLEVLTPDQERILALLNGSVEINSTFIQSLNIPTFDPNVPEEVDYSILLDWDKFKAYSRENDIVRILGRDVGPGVTKSQFRHIMRRCVRCARFCIKHEQRSHRCPGGNCDAWKGTPQDLVTYLFSSDQNAGLSEMDIRSQLVSCGSCGSFSATCILIVNRSRTDHAIYT
ncbi:hypothetical protein NMY22_g2564 [Coprinellus aureogranulatus]|nr:hypothetical protein NMY22_g2564 [Coprinellus aureogranulatus]